MRKNLLLAAAVTLVASSAFAQETAAPAAPVKPWKDTAEGSVVSTNGNSKTTTTAAKNNFNYKWSITELDVFGSALGAKSKGQVTDERYEAGQKVSVKATAENYVYEQFTWDKNRFAGIQNRYDVSVGVGRHLIDLPKDKLNTEIGGGYINEERINAPRNDFASGRAYAKYVRTLSATANFSQDVEYLADFKDTSGYRLNTETALTAAISTYFSLKASYDFKRVNRPPPGFTKNDTITSIALIFNY